MRTIEITVSETVSAALDRAGGLLGDLSAPMTQIADAGIAETDDNFVGEHDPLGVPWQITHRKAADSGVNILQKRGLLRGSIIGRGGPDSAEWGSEASGAAAIIAAVHQWGATIKPKTAKALRTPFGPRASVTIPARPFVGLNSRLESLVTEILSDHLTRAFAGSAAP